MSKKAQPISLEEYSHSLRYLVALYRSENIQGRRRFRLQKNGFLSFRRDPFSWTRGMIEEQLSPVFHFKHEVILKYKVWKSRRILNKWEKRLETLSED